jgi:hypothetical protein
LATFSTVDVVFFDGRIVSVSKFRIYRSSKLLEMNKGSIWSDSQKRIIEMYVANNDKLFDELTMLRDKPRPSGRGGRQKRMSSIQCPKCGSQNTTRFQWVPNSFFEYWTCWECNHIFIVDIKITVSGDFTAEGSGGMR